MLRIISKFWNWIKTIAFVTVVVLGLLSLLSSSNTPWNTPYKPFIVLSGSMRPTVHEGSIVFVKRGNRSLKPGDIITFLKPGNPRENVTHRITRAIKIKKKVFYLTKGDANNSEDLWKIQRESIWGKVIFTFPLIGYIVSFSKTKPGVILLIVIPMIIIMIDELRIIILQLKKPKKKNSLKNTSLIILFSLLIYNFSIFNYSNASFSDTITSTNQQLSTSCWQAPTAVALISPSNDTVIDSLNVDFTWNSTTSSCPIATISYNYQIYSDAGLSTLVLESGFLSNLSYSYNSIPEGEYWWRVQTQDQYNNLSNSLIYHLTIDRTNPTASLTVAGKTVEEKVTNGGFESGSSGWAVVGTNNITGSEAVSSPVTTVNAYSGSGIIRLGDIHDNPSIDGNSVWENRVMQSFNAGPKSLYLNYNYFTRDSIGDNPGFFMTLNGQQTFQINNLSSDGTNQVNTGWQTFYYDLSDHNDSKVNIIIYSGNTGDKLQQSWVYIDNVTTVFATANSGSNFTITPSDTGGSGINECKYRVDGGSWSDCGTFTISTAGYHVLEYYALDNAGNNSGYTVNLVVDSTSPAELTLTESAKTASSVTLSWTAPGNDGNTATTRAAKYDIHYQQLSDCSTFNFDTATKADKIPAPQLQGTTEYLEIIGLNPGLNYCFGGKSADEAPNWSGLSNILSVTTDSGLTNNPGDIVINELMWMGSSVSPNDKWLELRNMTDRTIDLSNFKLTKLSGGSESDMITASFSGKSISPHGYFLIAYGNSFGADDSQLNIAPDVWDSNLDLSDSDLQIKLYWNDSGTDYLIDTAWNGSPPAEGLYDSTPGSAKYYSMERTAIPGDGTNQLNWYTCIDGASTTDFFDGGADERGTPGAANRSENEPLTHQNEKERLYPTPTEEPTITPEVTPTPTEITETPTPTSPEIIVPTEIPTETPALTIEPTTVPEPTIIPSPEPSPVEQSVEPTP